MFSRRGLAIQFGGVVAGAAMLMFLVMGLSSAKAQQTVANQLVDVSNLLSPFERDGLGQVSEGLGGAAWLDYNNDGLLHLFITNGAGHPNALFRNNGDGTFTDVAAQAGVASGLGNSAVAAVDIDNDGCVDLFLVGEGAVAGVSETPNSSISITVTGPSPISPPSQGLTACLRVRWRRLPISTTTASWTCSSPVRATSDSHSRRQIACS